MEKKKQTDDYLYLKHAIENMMPANKILGLKILKIQSGYAYIQIPFKDVFIGDFIQKRWHGGILASIADTAGGVVGATLLSSTQDKLNTIDMRIDYLHGAIIGDIFAEAKIIKNGKTIIKANIELFQNDRKDPVAIARCVYSVLRNEY